MNTPRKYKSAVVRLIIERMSQTMAKGGVAACLSRLTTDGELSKHGREAKEWVTTAIRAVREAPGDNQWREATDEVIAGHILDKIEEKRKATKP